MTFKEEFGSIVEIRSGRQIYLRKVVLTNRPEDDTDGATTKTTIQNTERPNLQMIFVHGICGTELQFQSVLQSMHDQLLPVATGVSFTISCWLYDQVGCGQSPILSNYNDYRYEETQADLKALLMAEQNPIHDFPTPSSSLPTIVVGHSYGPSVFVPLLLSDLNLLPNLIGVVLISTSVRCSHLPLADGGHVIMRLPTFVLQCLQSQLTEAFIRIAVHPKHTELHDIIRTASQQNNMFVAQSYHRSAKWMTMSQLHQTIDRSSHETPIAITAPNVPQSPPQQALPTLIIHGTDDGVTPIECGQYMYNELLSFGRSSPDNDETTTTPFLPTPPSPPVTFVAIDVASHMVMIEQPHETALAIVNFIQSLPIPFNT